MTGAAGGAFADARFRRLIWLVLGLAGWGGVILLGIGLFAQQPPRAGFDLTLILDAARRIAAGSSPYLAGAVTTGTQAEDLFYSYPPPVAQAAVLIGWMTNGAALVLTGVGAVAGFAVIAAALAGEPSGLRGRAGLADVADVALPALALAAICYPFAIALLFGNLDAWFPLAYGAVLLATSGRSGRWVWSGGVLLAIATIAKLHPGALLAWLAFRGAREWGARRHGHQPSAPVEGVATGEPRQTAEAHSGAPAAWATLAIALGAMGLITGASLVIGGLGPWADYLALLRSGSGAAFASGLNIGPASQIALVLGDPALAPRLAAVVAGLALGLVVLAAVAIRSTPASFAVAAVASLTISPITWFHYPVAVMPVAVAAWVLARGTPGAVRTAWLLVGAVVIAALSISAPVAVWVAVAMVVLAVALVSADDGRPRAGTTYTDRP